MIFKCIEKKKRDDNMLPKCCYPKVELFFLLRASDSLLDVCTTCITIEASRGHILLYSRRGVG